VELHSLIGVKARLFNAMDDRAPVIPHIPSWRDYPGATFLWQCSYNFSLE